MERPAAPADQARSRPRPGVGRRKVAAGDFVIEHGQAELPQVVGAAHAAGCCPGRLHGRQQHAHEHADDGDHDEQLHERKTAPGMKRHMTSPRIWCGASDVHGDAHDTVRAGIRDDGQSARRRADSRRRGAEVHRAQAARRRGEIDKTDARTRSGQQAESLPRRGAVTKPRAGAIPRPDPGRPASRSETLLAASSVASVSCWTATTARRSDKQHVFCSPSSTTRRLESLPRPGRRAPRSRPAPRGSPSPRRQFGRCVAAAVREALLGGGAAAGLVHAGKRPGAGDPCRRAASAHAADRGP